MAFVVHFSPFDGCRVSSPNPKKKNVPKQALVFTCLPYKSYGNIVFKGEIARNDQFIPFPTVVFTRFGNFLPFSLHLELSSANSFSLEESKICHLRKGSQFKGLNKDRGACSVLN